MIGIAEAIKQYLVGTIVPLATSSLVTWLTSAKVLAVLSLSPTTAAKDISAALIFVVTYAFGWLSQHKILAGHYTPAARRQ
jgi:hypothetical protein